MVLYDIVDINNTKFRIKKMDAGAVQPLSVKNNGMMHPSNDSIYESSKNVNSGISENANTQYSDRYESEYLCVLDNYLTIDCKQI